MVMAADAEGLGHPGKIGVVRQVHFRVIAVKKQLLPLAHHAQHGVVQQHDAHINAVALDAWPAPARSS